MKQFHTPQHCLDYLLAEIVDTLRDDLERQEGSERQHYEDEDRKIMRDTIADIEAIIPDVILFSHDERVTLRGALGLAAATWGDDINDGCSEADEVLWQSHITDIETLDERLSP